MILSQPLESGESALRRLTMLRSLGARCFGFGETGSRPPALWRQYLYAFTVFLLVSALNLWLQKWLGYQTIALVYLLGILLLALFVNRGPIVFGTVVTAIGWRFLFAPPRFSFSIADSYDEMMFATYFVVGMTVGQLTTRLRAQRDTEIQARLLAESERLGRTLLNSVSHELRTPVAAINSAANTLRAGETLTAGQRILAEEIETAGARLNRVVQSLLSAARVQSGQLRPRLDWCDCSDLVQVVLRGVKGCFANHPIETRLEPGLPLVRADFVLMEQALANLVVNALTHTPPNTPIEISVRAAGGELTLSVADRGPGLPPDQLDRIFELFHRAPDAKPGGTGLGLAIARVSWKRRAGARWPRIAKAAARFSPCACPRLKNPFCQRKCCDQ